MTSLYHVAFLGLVAAVVALPSLSAAEDTAASNPDAAATSSGAASASSSERPPLWHPEWQPPPGQIIVPKNLPPSPADYDAVPGIEITPRPAWRRVPLRVVEVAPESSTALESSPAPSAALAIAVPQDPEAIAAAGYGAGSELRWSWRDMTDGAVFQDAMAITLPSDPAQRLRFCRSVSDAANGGRRASINPGLRWPHGPVAPSVDFAGQ